ncbi:MAG TPA: hypothetical protein DCQ56_04615 [Porphyromonadaceae bacterium]|nr:hypothetical protein [Porphyromonadaceae bacterium]
MLFKIFCKIIKYFVIYKRLAPFCIIFGAASTGLAQQPRLNAVYLEYIDRYKEVAIKHHTEFGVPASITLAQGLLESRAGRSYLATQGNNHFGIKCHRWAGEHVEWDDTLKHDCYRKYASAEDSFEDHARFLCGRRYQPLHRLDSTDYKGWATGLRQCGYAEDPAYPEKLIALIEQYELQRYDTCWQHDDAPGNASADNDDDLPDEDQDDTAQRQAATTQRVRNAFGLGAASADND